MEDPPAEIPRIIHLLTQSPPSIQHATIEKYFAPNAAFIHPFCRTGNIPTTTSTTIGNSRWQIWCIYRWYKILSPRIDLRVNSVAFDAAKLTLYVSVHQGFRIWFVPLYKAEVDLVTVLQLVEREVDIKSNSSGGSMVDGEGTVMDKKKKKRVYLIQSQNDLYQTSEFVKFVSWFGILTALVYVWQLISAGFCVVGAVLLWPFTLAEERMMKGGSEKRLGEAVKG